MTISRKSASGRRRELEIAISRILRGRGTDGDAKISITSVAREAGVSPSLIHNHYPDIAERIREAQGRSRSAQAITKENQLKLLEARNRELRLEVDQLKAQVAKLASLNENLIAENRAMKATIDNPKVISLEFNRRLFSKNSGAT